MKFLLLTLLLTLASCASFAHPQKRVLMVINEGFQIDEYFTPRRIFEEAGFEITVASRFGGEVRPGRKYWDTTAPVKADLNFSEIDVAAYDAITFTGGGGAWSDYFPDQTLHKVLMAAVKREDMVVGLICAATGLLAVAQNLDGSNPQFKNRHVTGYADVSGLLKTQGQVNYDAGDLTKPKVVVDGNLVTGRDPMSAGLFGQKVLELLRAK